MSKWSELKSYEGDYESNLLYVLIVSVDINGIEKKDNPITDKAILFLKQYLKSMYQFVFEENTHALGMGAYFISLLIIHLSVQTNETFGEYLKKLESSQPQPANECTWYNHTHTKEQLMSNFDIIYNNVNSFNYTYTDPKCRNLQEPYLVGYFSFTCSSTRYGSCQDRAIINLMKEKTLDMSLFCRNFRLQHWDKTLDYGFDTYDDAVVVSESEDFSSIRKLRHVIMLKTPDDQDSPDDDNAYVEEREIIVNRQNKMKEAKRIGEYTPNFPNEYLQQQLQYSRQHRAFVFLLLTLSHVHRHSLPFGINDHGIAFNGFFESNMVEFVQNYILKNDTIENSSERMLKLLFTRDCNKIREFYTGLKVGGYRKVIPKKPSTTKSSYKKTNQKIEVRKKGSNSTYQYTLYETDKGSHFYFVKDSDNVRKKRYVQLNKLDKSNQKSESKVACKTSSKPVTKKSTEAKCNTKVSGKRTN